MSEKDLINAALMRRAELVEALAPEGLKEEEKAALEASVDEIDNYLADKLMQLNADVDSSGVSYNLRTLPFFSFSFVRHEQPCASVH